MSTESKLTALLNLKRTDMAEWTRWRTAGNCREFRRFYEGFVMRGEATKKKPNNVGVGSKRL